MLATHGLFGVSVTESVVDRVAGNNTGIRETLYHQTEEFDLICDILDGLDSEEDADRFFAERQLAALLERIEDKVDGYANAIERLIASGEYRKAQAKSIAALGDRDINRANRLKEYLLHHLETRMQFMGKRGKIISGKLREVETIVAGGNQAVEDCADDIDNVPDEFIATVRQVNVAELRDRCRKDGEVLGKDGKPIARLLPRKSYLRIR
jgi:hypothetical protein